MDKTDIQKQIQRLQAEMEIKLQRAEKDSKRYVVTSCAEVERTAKTIMRDTVTNPNVSYGPHHHHPSVEGNPPAPDSGTLLQSVTHSVDVDSDGKVTGYVGSILKNPDYPRYLEYGTSNMKPRPWLSASLTKCQSFMDNLFREIFGK